MNDVSDDSTPQLGGNLDTNNHEIITASNRDLILAANGTGAVEIKGNTNSGKLLFNCENNSHHVSLQAPAHSAFSGNIALTLPTSTGTSGQALVTNGSGVLSFSDVAGGGNYLGNDGEIGNDANDIIRVHSATLNYSGTLTLASTENGLVAGPLAVAGSTILDVQGTLVVL